MRNVLRDFNNVGQVSSLSLTQRRQAGSLSYIMAGLMAALSLTACSPQQKQPTAPQNNPLSSFQAELLQTAFEIASAIPIRPHLDSRSKAQKRVFDGAVTLEQMDTAGQFAEQMKDWRRGVAHADLAFYYAGQDEVQTALRELDLAEQIARAIQDWPRDRILARLAQASVLLKDSDSAERLTSGIGEQEAAKATHTEATLCTEAQYESQKETLLGLLQHNRYDHRKQGVLSSSALFARFYLDPTKREQIGAMIREYWIEFDSGFKVETLFTLCEAAFLHTDLPYALKLLREGREILDSSPVHPRQQIPLLAQLAALTFRAGDSDSATETIARAETMYSDRLAWIVNIYRPETLVALAEAYHTMGRPDSALGTFRRAVEACVENPNSRPRAENLSLVCTSMAVNGVEPDEVLWTRIREIQTNLNDPW